MKMNGTLGFWDKVGFGMEEALAWFIESGAIGHMMQGEVIPLDSELAVEAGRLGHTLKIPMADSIILATARHRQAVLWTQDEDFKSIPGVRYIPKLR